MNLFNDTPFNTFSARGRGKGTIIAPVVSHVNSAEELAHIDLCGGVIDGSKDTVNEWVRGGAALFHIEEDSDDGAVKLCACAQGVSCRADARTLVNMHKVDLGIVELSANGVLRGRVEMELLRCEV